MSLQGWHRSSRVGCSLNGWRTSSPRLAGISGPDDFRHPVHHRKGGKRHRRASGTRPAHGARRSPESLRRPKLQGRCSSPNSGSNRAHKPHKTGPRPIDDGSGSRGAKSCRRGRGREQWAGTDGLVAAPPDIPALRALSECPNRLTVSRGNRLRSEPMDGHARTASASDAIRLAADHIVVGRPFLNAPEPGRVVREILENCTNGDFLRRPNAAPQQETVFQPPGKQASLHGR